MRKTRLFAARAALLFFAVGVGVVPPGLTPRAVPQTTRNDPGASEEPRPSESSAPSGTNSVGIVSREPYVRWKNHTGTAAEAAVCVTVQITHPETGKTEVRRGNGFVVRCDGFVMVPGALIALAPGAGVKDQKNVLTFKAADGPVPPPQTVSYPRYFRKNCDFVLLKVNGHHFKSLPLLHPRNVREGGAVSLVYARSRQDNPAEVETVTVAAAVGAAEPNGEHVSLTFAPGREPGAPLVPAGALVVDAASGYALGIVPQAGAAHFTTFARFHTISNAVALRPDPEARQVADAPDAPDASHDNSMVWVPGGPVALAKDDYTEFANLYGGRPVVCTPGFWIDRLEVTNGEYREFLIATKHKRLPNGWTKSELTQPTWDATYPVNGVTPEDAAAYAAWRGKRLVTPTEWLRATQGAGGPWLVRLLSAKRELHVLLERSRREEEVERRLTLKDLKRRGIRVERNLSIQTEALKQILAAREQVVAEFMERFGDPNRLMPVGWRKEDRSDFGVQDVAMNVPELLQPNYAQGSSRDSARAGNKIFAALYDPIREYKFFKLGQGGTWSRGVDGRINHYDWHTIDIGFRCAR